MGVFSRPDSAFWYLWLESAPPGEEKVKTRIKIGTTIAQRHDSHQLALDLYHQTMNALAVKIHRLPTELPAIRFSAYAVIYRTDVIAHHKGQVREAELLLPLLAYFGTDGDDTKDVLLALVDKALVQSYLTWRTRTVTPATANREVDLLKAMLKNAVPKYLEASPIAGMKRLKSKKPKRRLMHHDEERRLLKVAKADPQDYALIVLGMDTLVRLGDLLDLQRTDRHKDGLWIDIPDPKSDDPYEVPLSKRAAKALDAIRHDQPYYFAKFRQAENPRDWRGSVRQRLEILCRDAKVDFGKVNKGITFHWATRRTGATRLLVQKGVPVAVVQKLGNWAKPDVLLEIYTEAERGDLLAAVGQPRVKRSGRPLPPRSRSKRKSA